MLALAPGTRLPPGSPGYGQGCGHFETKFENFAGPTTMLVGTAICCCTCCPCGFMLKLDGRRIDHWVVDPPGSHPAPAPTPMTMGAPSVVSAPSTASAGRPGPTPGPTVPAAPPPASSAISISVQCGSCGNVVNVQPQSVGQIQFDCPHCKMRNQITWRGAPGAPKPVPPPTWWKKQPNPGDNALCSVSNKEVTMIQQLLDMTWKNTETRDRVNFQGTRKVAKFQVVQVQQNCNPRLWENYARARADIASKMGGSAVYTSKTSDCMGAIGGEEFFGPLETGANEFYMFHGTKPTACDAICKSDFMVRMAGSNAGTLYGPGIYFAECSSKSDEYASDEASGIYQGLYAMLLCRVTCGRVLYTDEVKPNVDDLVRKCTVTKEYDCVLGDREKARGTYREFIVFNNDQAYPAYVVIYKRLEED